MWWVPPNQRRKVVGLVERTLWAEYLICRERGHVGSGPTLSSNPPWHVCPRCQTHFRYEERLIESNVPADPGERTAETESP